MTTSDEIDEIFREHLTESERKNAIEAYEGMPMGALLILAILTAIGGAICAKTMELLRKISLKSVLLWTMLWASLNVLLQAAGQYWTENDISGQIHAALPNPEEAAGTVVQISMDFVVTSITLFMAAILSIKLIGIIMQERY